MADSTTHLDLVGSVAAQREVTFNELVDALSPALLYGRRASKCSGLTWCFYGGRYLGTSVNGGTRLLVASATNYMVASRLTGTVTFNTAATDWDNESEYMRLYLIVTGTADVTSYEDHRAVTGRYNLG